MTRNGRRELRHRKFVPPERDDENGSPSPDKQRDLLQAPDGPCSSSHSVEAGEDVQEMRAPRQLDSRDQAESRYCRRDCAWRTRQGRFLQRLCGKGGLLGSKARSAGAAADSTCGRTIRPNPLSAPGELQSASTLSSVVTMRELRSNMQAFRRVCQAPPPSISERGSEQIRAALRLVATNKEAWSSRLGDARMQQTATGTPGRSRAAHRRRLSSSPTARRHYRGADFPSASATSVFTRG